MNFFENKSIFQKITIAILIVTIASFIFSGNVRADDDGVLVKPVMSLLNSLGDGIMDVIHSILLNQTESSLRVDLKGESKGWIGCAVAIILAVAIAVAVIFTGGAALAALPGIWGGIAAGLFKGIVVVAAGAYTISVVQGEGKALGGQIVLPLFNVSPDTIFSGSMAIFDVDFINPNTETKTVITGKKNAQTPTYYYTLYGEKMPLYGSKNLRDLLQKISSIEPVDETVEEWTYSRG